MKFRIRFADQIVGAFIILAVLAIAVAVFFLGSKQRWFAKDYSYKTYLESATGLGDNMPVHYKGFTIGRVRSSTLTKDDRVEVVFTIHDIYDDRVTEGSVVDLSVSPLGGIGGNRFLFYPGRGSRKLSEGDFIPLSSSPEGRAFIEKGLTSAPPADDKITLIVERVNTILGQIQDAFAGTGETAIGRVVGNLDGTITRVNSIANNLDGTLEPVLHNINELVSGLNVLAGDLADPDSLVRSVLDTDGVVYRNLTSSLDSLSGLMRNLEKTSAFLPEELPHVAGLISELRVTLKTAEDVLVALTNNPLLRKGIPAQVETQSSGTNPRGIEF